MMIGCSPFLRELRRENSFQHIETARGRRRRDEANGLARKFRRGRMRSEDYSSLIRLRSNRFVHFAVSDGKVPTGDMQTEERSI